MIRAWGDQRDLVIQDGTLNLCSRREIELPDEYISLARFGHLAGPPRRRSTPGFSPRLYPAILDDHSAVWIYRWSAPADLRGFVGDADECKAENRAEVVSETYLRETGQLKDGDLVTLRLLEHVAPTV